MIIFFVIEGFKYFLKQERENLCNGIFDKLNVYHVFFLKKADGEKFNENKIEIFEFILWAIV